MLSSLLIELEPLKALVSGWLVLLAAEAWDTATLRRVRAVRRLPLILIPALVIGGAAAAAWNASDRMVVAVLVGCASIALDPDAVRDLLGRATRPDATARMAPALATLALGFALILSAASSGDRSYRSLLAYPLGALMGLLLAGLLRLAQGRGMILTLLFAMPILGWGLARYFDLSPLAALFVAGTVVTDDPTRRDLVFSLLREYELPARIAMLILVAMSLPMSLEPFGTIPFWGILALLVLVRPLVWRLIPGTGLSLRQLLPLSPLVLLLGLEAGHAPLALAISLSWILGEAARRAPNVTGGSPR
ncbi:MAG TPA: hypothetical protein VGK94_05945 [Candidatus Polarisedimenticolia bacterium]|jgi:hypothetical protein